MPSLGLATESETLRNINQKKALPGWKRRLTRNQGEGDRREGKRKEGKLYVMLRSELLIERFFCTILQRPEGRERKK